MTSPWKQFTDTIQMQDCIQKWRSSHCCKLVESVRGHLKTSACFIPSVTFAFDASDGPACGGNCEGDSNSVGEGFSESGLSWLGVDFLGFQKSADQRDLLDARL